MFVAIFRGLGLRFDHFRVQQIIVDVVFCNLSKREFSCPKGWIVDFLGQSLPIHFPPCIGFGWKISDVAYKKRALDTTSILRPDGVVPLLPDLTVFAIL